MEKEVYYEEEDYIEHHFRIIDGKITISNVHNKKRGRKKGYKHNTLTKNKIADKMRHRTKSPEEKLKISNRLKGRKKSLQTIERISTKKRETWPADDLLKDYLNPGRREDREWLNIHMSKEDSEEIRQWIENNYEVFNDSVKGCVLTYKDLRACSMKEQVELLEQYRNVKGEIK